MEHVVNLIEESDTILVGAGAGASAAAGLTYSGTRFTDNFGEFIKKYGTIPSLTLKRRINSHNACNYGHCGCLGVCIDMYYI